MPVTANRECEIKAANEWIRESRKRPIPRTLFGEFWLEGEMAILFADTGKGKSVLAMQIAESIASAKKIEPFQMNSEPQTVLYVDLEMNDKQFEMRYAADHDGGRARFLHKHYIFSDNLDRVEFDPAEHMRDGESSSDVFCRILRQMVEEKKAGVVIVDSITCLKRTFYGVRETLELMKGLKRLRKELNLSILVLIQTSKRADSLALTSNCLQGLKILCSRADSIFGIGPSRLDPAGRYIKRVRALGNAIDYDALHVPAFRLKKIGGNFLGFEFECFAPEIEMLTDIRDQPQWETIERVKQLSEGGMSIREIAAEIELPKTTVHRLLQMWRPPAHSSPPYEGGVARFSSPPARGGVAPASGDEVVVAADGVVLSEFDPTTNEFYFPGREEYVEAGRDPRFNNIYDREGEEFHLLHREAYLIEAACAKAHKEYKKTGKAPTLAEMLERMAEPVTAAAAVGSVSVPPELAGGLTPDPANVDEQDALCHDGLNNGHIQPPATPTTPSAQSGCHPSSGRRGAGGTDKTSSLKRSTDGYGREIFIEKEGTNGKPDIWYDFDSKDRKQRKVRKGNTVVVTLVE